MKNKLGREIEPTNNEGFYSIIEYDILNPEIQHEFVERFAEIQRTFVSGYPGYLSSTFLVSTDGKRIYNLVQWNTESDFSYFENTSDAQSRSEAIDKTLKKLDYKAIFRRVGSPRFRILRKVYPS